MPNVQVSKACCFGIHAICNSRVLTVFVVSFIYLYFFFTQFFSIKTKDFIRLYLDVATLGGAQCHLADDDISLSSVEESKCDEDESDRKTDNDGDGDGDGDGEKVVEKTKQEGAKVLMGGKRPAGFNKGFFYEPTDVQQLH